MSLYYSYYKDALRTYLILMGPEAGEEEGYQYRMIAANQIRGLVPCKLRHVNDRCFLYYDVTAKRALCNLAEKDRMSAEEVKEVLYSIVEAQRHIASFLLDADRLLLSPDFIFREYDAGAYSFLYYPRAGKEGTEEEKEEDTSAKDLILFLLRALKPGEVRMKRILEKLSVFSREPDFVLEETVLDHLFEREEPRRKREVRPMIPYENRTTSGEMFTVDELFFDDEDLNAEETGTAVRFREEEDPLEEERSLRFPVSAKHLFLPAAFFLVVGLTLEVLKFLRPRGILLPSFTGGVILVLLACSALLSVAGVVLTVLENHRADREAERERMLYEREKMTETLEYARG